MMKKFVIFIVVAAVFAAILCGCGGGNASDEIEDSPSFSDFETENDSLVSDSDESNGVVSDENGEWWGIEF